MCPVLNLSQNNNSSALEFEIIVNFERSAARVPYRTYESRPDSQPTALTHSHDWNDVRTEEMIDNDFGKSGNDFSFATAFHVRRSDANTNTANDKWKQPIVE